MVSGYCIRQSKSTTFLSSQKVLLDSTVVDGTWGNVNKMPVTARRGIRYDAIKNREVPEQMLAMLF